jgi:rubrerythrin
MRCNKCGTLHLRAFSGGECPECGFKPEYLRTDGGRA